MIDYYIYYPGGNTTALVEMEDNSNLPRMAKKIMDSNPVIEQVGFLGEPRRKGCDFHLEMMGGEFCGNAARSAALHVALLKNKSKILFTVSGFDAPVNAVITGNQVELILPGSFLKAIRPVADGYVVELEGIIFFVTKSSLSIKDIKTLVKRYGKGSPAAGVITLKQKSKGCSITPWVWVASTKTLIAETSCASGTLAAANVLRLDGEGKTSYSVTQPSGKVYKVKIGGSGKKIKYFSLSGPVTRLTSVRI